MADAVMAYDLYKRNVDGILSKFVLRDSPYDLRASTMQLLVEPPCSNKYLYDQPVVRLIRLINRYKSIVCSSNTTFSFKTRIMEELGICIR